jgi:hypothetical protein
VRLTRCEPGVRGDLVDGLDPLHLCLLLHLCFYTRITRWGRSELGHGDGDGDGNGDGF